MGCTSEEMTLALATHRTAWQAAILLVRPTI